MAPDSSIPVAAPTSPTVAAALTKAQADSIILTAVQSGDSAAQELCSAIYSQAEEVNNLLAALVPSLGPNIDTRA